MLVACGTGAGKRQLLDPQTGAELAHVLLFRVGRQILSCDLLQHAGELPRRQPELLTSAVLVQFVHERRQPPGDFPYRLDTVSGHIGCDLL